MSDKPSEESLSKVLLEDKQLVENSDTNNSNNHVDLALGAAATEEDTEEITEFDQIMIGIQERMARVMARVSSSCTLVNQLQRDLKAQLPGRLMDAGEAKKAGGDGESKQANIDMTALEKMTEGPGGSKPLPITEEILTEKEEEN